MMVGEQILNEPRTFEEVEFAERLENSLEEVITFNGKYRKYCVGIVDLVGSTKITASLSKTNVCKFYGIFLNAMAMIAKEQGATVVKNIGDSLLFYFPETSNPEKASFIKPLECGLTMLRYSSVINEKMKNEGLPNAKYRVSVDYGEVMLAKSVTSSRTDIFGPTVNLCNKINHSAQPNQMVIGSDLYQIVKRFGVYDFDLVPAYSSGLKVQYPVYSVKPKYPQKFYDKKGLVSLISVLGGLSSALNLSL